MAYSPSSPYLVKLQDLKLWQCNYDNLLKTKTDTAHPSDFETIEGLSALDSPDLTPQMSPRQPSVDWDKKVLTPAKPFEQLLEEKLAEDQPVKGQGKAKKPFLKKGSGLLRYNLVPKHSTGRKAERRRASHEEKIHDVPKTRPKTPIQNEDSGYKDQQSLTPLKVPEFSIRSKTAWVKPDDEENHENSVVRESTNSHQKNELNPAGFHSNIIERINEFALKHLLPVSPRKCVKVLCEKNCIPLSEVNCAIKQDSDVFNTTEKELKLFEALEECAENSSFSSTNSSVMRLLSSTPSKKNNLMKSPILEESTRECQFLQNRRLNQKLKEVNEKSDLLSDFLNNLRKISKDKYAAKSGKENREITPDTSFSEEEKSSTNTDTRTHSPSSLYTDFETTYRETTKVDAAVNTSDLEKPQYPQNDKGCSECEELKDSLNRLKREVPDIQAEKAKLCDFAKDLEKKRDQLSKEIEKLRKKYDKDIGELQEELDSEKKKFLREKSIFDMYLKEAQNRPNKKEREEISGLKKELADIKELLKLKDTKNGATQARLRNHIKQLEKERTELKSTVDSLQKENSKLNAIQKVRRPAESKMLHEINKNLSKLTEESLKSQLNKSDSCGSKKTSLDDVKKGRRKSTGDASGKPDREIISPKSNRKPLPNFKRRLSEDIDSVIEDSNDEHQTTDNGDFSVEKQYETTFGQSTEAPTRINMKESKEVTKTTKVFPDGSKEIKYSNGSWKTVSPDSQLITFKYYNGDIKETNMKEGTVKYYFAESSTWITEFPDGSEVVEYAKCPTKIHFGSNIDPTPYPQLFRCTRCTSTRIGALFSHMWFGTQAKLDSTRDTRLVGDTTLTNSWKNWNTTEKSMTLQFSSFHGKYSSGISAIIPSLATSPVSTCFCCQPPQYQNSLLRFGLCNSMRQSFDLKNLTAFLIATHEFMHFLSGQKERKYKDGKIEVQCPDGRSLTRGLDGSNEISYPDGSKLLQTTDGQKIIMFPNGQKEFHTKEHKRREYPDGTVKFIYPDGTRETRYSSGRVRIKDSNNVLIMDTHGS
ncbi:unnamed protein product [Phaedon cochleariae]|uniref:Centromere protein J C-terminal domain-containing protein n=1 Tax=Phaedon cochleariae TaxID=80249 RepID=A0A9N9X338_PHACE|nr:unnamed protein product [Phaedon cochleariae]